jgi:hypothetical protein
MNEYCQFGETPQAPRFVPLYKQIRNTAYQCFIDFHPKHSHKLKSVTHKLKPAVEALPSRCSSEIKLTSISTINTELSTVSAREWVFFVS